LGDVRKFLKFPELPSLRGEFRKLVEGATTARYFALRSTYGEPCRPRTSFVEEPSVNQAIWPDSLVAKRPKKRGSPLTCSPAAGGRIAGPPETRSWATRGKLTSSSVFRWRTFSRLPLAIDMESVAWLRAVARRPGRDPELTTLGLLVIRGISDFVHPASR